MRSIFLIFLFMTSSLFALQKDYTSFEPLIVGSTPYFGYDEQACITSATNYDKSDTTLSDSSTDDYCISNASSNAIDLNKLQLLKSEEIVDYKPSAICDSSYENDRDRTDGKLSYTYTEQIKTSYSCSFECKDIPKPADMGDDAVFDDKTCTWHKPCSDKAPDGWLPYPSGDDAHSCKPYNELSISEQEKYAMGGGLVCDVCFAPPYDEHNCLPPKILNTHFVPNICTNDLDKDGIPNNEDDDIDGDGVPNSQDSNPDDASNFSGSCKSLGYKTNIPKSLCSGYNTLWDFGLYGKLVFQDCDNTCYVVEPLPIPCSQYSQTVVKNLFSKCDLDLENPKFLCTDGSSSPFRATSVDVTCEAKNKDYRSPCDVAFEKKQNECKQLNKSIEGDCQDNGIDVVSNTLSCIDKVPDCSSKWYEQLNNTTNQCDCIDGYKRNKWGDCSKDLYKDIPDENLTDTEKQLQEKEDLNAHEKNLDRNQTFQQSNNSSQLLKNSNDIKNTLAGVRSDLNSTNSLLASIKSLLSNKDGNGSNDSTSFSYVEDAGQKADREATDTILDNAYDTLDGLKSDYDNLIGKLDKGFVVGSASSGSTPIFSTQALGTTISFNLCSTFSTFYSIFYFIFTVIIYYITIVIYIKAFKIQ